LLPSYLHEGRGGGRVKGRGEAQEMVTVRLVINQAVSVGP
jgi:hypothetical protein